LKVAVVAAVFAQSHSIRMVKRRGVVAAEASILDVVVPSEDVDTVFAEVGRSTNDEELQLTHEEEMQLVSDQTKFKTEINNYRKSLGLGTVCYNSALNTAAKEYAELLFRHNLTARHNGPDGSCQASRTVAAGYCYSRVGECGGSGRISVVHMFNGWKNSPTHDAIMKNGKYVEMGMWCNPRSFDPDYRCFLLMGSHFRGNRCCVESGCTQKKERCCGSNSNYPRVACRQCCSKNTKFPFCR